MEHERLSWFDRCRSYRDQLIASPRVQRWALANPLTRPIARRRARAMLDLCAGFVYSQVLFTCVRLRLFDILFKEPLTTAALAERLSLSPEATCRLLDAAVSLGLAERRGRSVYGLGQLGAALAGNRAALSLIEHQPLLYADPHYRKGRILSRSSVSFMTMTMPRPSHFCGPCAERCHPMARSSSRRRCRASGAPNRWTPIMDSI